MHEPDHVSETPGEHNVSDNHLYQRELMACEHMDSRLILPVHRLNNGSGCRSRWKMRLRSPCHDRVRCTVVHAGRHTARPLAPNILRRVG